jgi:pimeloyl-ACP methyl ester carboxylesterase
MNTSLPYPVATPEFPQAASRELWDQVLDGIRQDRPGFFASAFRGPLGIGENQVDDETLERYERMTEAADALAIERCLQSFTQVDFCGKLAALNQGSDVPILLLHGDSDAGSPVQSSAERVKQIVPRANLKLYEKGSHSKFGIFISSE